jgi:ATP-dependent DNA ligase
MKRFAALYAELDATTATNPKVAALVRYFRQVPEEDAAWAVYFLAGGKPRQIVPTQLLYALACERAGIEPWLFDLSYEAVGDFAETVAHVLPAPTGESELGLAAWVTERLLPLRGADPATQRARIAQYWDELGRNERFLMNKLITGELRVGVSKLLVQRALAEAFAVDPKRVAQRMMGYTDARGTPSAARFRALVSASEADGNTGQPYPFFLAHPLDVGNDGLAARLGAPADWIVEWKYDGIRAQVIKRAGQAWIWSRGEELVTERFPEVASAASSLADGTVLDGEIVAWKDGRIAPFALLQQRIGRKLLSPKVLADAPVAYVAYDLLELGGVDLRDKPLSERRALLADLLAEHPAFHLSPVETADSWDALERTRESSRARGVEGFMLKHRDSRYGIGRRKQDDGGAWWKWKIEPFAVDAALVYAEPGSGRRASLYTDYTFAVWNRVPRDAREVDDYVAALARHEAPAAQALQLVPFAKAYSGLTDKEIREVDRLVRRTTVDKFGPVRSLAPSLVCEIGFEGSARSARHKSGVAVRFPRILRMRTDKPLHEADTLASLQSLLGAGQPDDASGTC